MAKLSSYSFILLIVFSLSACSIMPRQKINRQVTNNHNPINAPETRAPQKYTHSQQQPSSRPQVSSRPSTQRYPLSQRIDPARLRMINVAQSVVGVPYNGVVITPNKVLIVVVLPASYIKTH
jgi:hypothetical protein